MSSRDPRTGRQSAVSPRGETGQGSESAGFRLSPGVVFLAIALVLSVVYGIYALTIAYLQMPHAPAWGVALGSLTGLAVNLASARLPSSDGVAPVPSVMKIGRRRIRSNG